MSFGTMSVDLSRSVIISGEITARDLLRFLRHWRGLDIVEACRVVRSGLFEVTFKEQCYVDVFEDMGSPFDVSGKVCVQRRADSKIQRVEIHELTQTFPDGEVRHHLSRFGKIHSFEKEKWRCEDAYEVQTGVRVVYMEPDDNLPVYLMMDGHQVRLYNMGVVIMCQRCGEMNHSAGNCQKEKCYNCFELGHTVLQCKVQCRTCYSQDHPKQDCDQLIMDEGFIGLGIGALDNKLQPLVDESTNSRFCFSRMVLIEDGQERLVGQQNNRLPEINKKTKRNVSNCNDASAGNDQSEPVLPPTKIKRLEETIEKDDDPSKSSAQNNITDAETSLTDDPDPDHYATWPFIADLTEDKYKNPEWIVVFTGRKVLLPDKGHPIAQISGERVLPVKYKDQVYWLSRLEAMQLVP